jgi:mRNA-degrading endonuclease RelE of RelBE toxin-antitoxin system
MQSKYKHRVSDDLADFVRGAHPDLKRKIKSALKRILSNPYSGKSLREELKGLSSYRVGRFRIIYRVASNHIIAIVATGPRKIIYEITYRIVKKGGQKKILKWRSKQSSVFFANVRNIRRLSLCELACKREFSCLRSLVMI